MVEAVVEFDYQATEEDELNLVKGDIITNVAKMDGGWWEGTLKGKTGMFPDNFVKEITKKEKNKDMSGSVKRGSATGAGGGHVAELANRLGKEGLKVGAGPAKRQDSKPQGASIENQPAAASGIPYRVRVAHSYTPKNDDELELIVGQIINITSKEEEGWWEGTTSDGRAGVFPSNFVEEIKDEEDADGEFHAIQGKKVKGIGFGNIFAGGPVKLKGAKKQDSDATEHAKPPPQEAKRKSHAPPVPSEPQNAAPKEKPVWRPVKSKSTSAIGSKTHREDNQAKAPHQQFFYMTGKTVMSYTAVSSDDRKDEERRKSPEDIIGDYRRKSRKDVTEDQKDVREKWKVCNTIVYDGSDSEEDPVWIPQEKTLECKMLAEQAACKTSDDSEDDIEHTSVDCMYSCEEDSEDEDGLYEVYVPYSKDVSNSEQSHSTDSESEAANDSNLTCISELEQSSFLSNAGNVSTASEVTVPMELGNLCRARQTPPPKLTFRKRRSVSTPKNSPMPTLISTVTPPHVDIPPVKKQRVSPTSVHLADREGPLGLVPLDSSTTEELKGPLLRHAIDSVPEESFVEEVSEASTDASPNQYFSAVESSTSGGFFTPVDSQSPNISDDTMTALPGLLMTPEYRSTGSKKRVSFSPQDHYMVPSSRKLHMPNIWAHSPLKYLRRRNSTPSRLTPTTFECSKPLEADQITDSVKLARQRRLSTGVGVHMRNQSVQVTLLPVIKQTHDVATEIEQALLQSPLKEPVEFNKLPEYVPYSIKDIERMRLETLKCAGDQVDKPVDTVDEKAVADDVSKRAKTKRRSSFAQALASAFTPKKKASRKSESYTPEASMNEQGDQCRSSPQSAENAITNSTEKVESLDGSVEQNANPLNLRDSQSDDAFELNPILIPAKVDNDLTFTEKSVTLPLSANASQISEMSQIYYVPTKAGSSDDVSYFGFMQKRGRISPAIQNIVKKYRISTGGSEGILKEDCVENKTESGLDAVAQGHHEDLQEVPEEPAVNEMTSEPDEPESNDDVCASKEETSPKLELVDQKDVIADAENNAGCGDNAQTANELNAEIKENAEKDLSLDHAEHLKDSIVDIEYHFASGDNAQTSVDCNAETTVEDTENAAQEADDSKVSIQEIYDDLKEVQVYITESFTKLPKDGDTVQKIADADTSNKSGTCRAKIEPSAFFDVERRPSSGSPRQRRRKKIFTPPSSGKARRVPITVEHEEEAYTEICNDLTITDIEIEEDLVNAAPKRGKGASRDKINEGSDQLKADTVDARQQKSVSKKKFGHSRSLFHKFKRKKGTKKNEDKKAEIKESVSDKKETTQAAAVEEVTQKPRKVSLFRRFSQKIRGKKHPDVPDGGQVTFADVAELCLPDNSKEMYSARKELFGNDHTPSSSTVSRLPEEVSTTTSSDFPEKSLDNAATEADSLKVLIDQDDQLAMEGELTGTEEDWQILSHMLKTSPEKKSPLCKEQSMDSIRDEYIDDELNDTMELTGDLYSGTSMQEDVVSPGKVQIEVKDEPNYTSTPTKPTETLSPSLEVLFSDVGGAMSREPNIELCDGDHLPRSPALLSYHSDDVNALVNDTPEKRLYYNLTNQDLSPSIGGTGDADQRSAKSSVPGTPQIKQTA